MLGKLVIGNNVLFLQLTLCYITLPYLTYLLYCLFNPCKKGHFGLCAVLLHPIHPISDLPDGAVFTPKTPLPQLVYLLVYHAYPAVSPFLTSCIKLRYTALCFNHTLIFYNNKQFACHWI